MANLEEKQYVLYYVPERGTPWSKKTKLSLPLSAEEAKVFVHPAGHRWAGITFTPPKYKITLTGGDGVVVDEASKVWFDSNWPGKFGGSVYGGNDDDPESFKSLRIDPVDKKARKKGDVIVGYYKMPTNWDVPAPQEGSRKIPSK